MHSTILSGNRRRVVSPAIILLAGAAWLSPSASATSIAYNVANIGPTTPMALSSTGMVTGDSTEADEAFLYNGALDLIGWPAKRWSESTGTDINTAGAMVVTVDNCCSSKGTTYKAFVAKVTGSHVRWVALGATRKRPMSDTGAIADDGDVAGDVFSSEDAYFKRYNNKAVLWRFLPGPHTYQRESFPLDSVGDLISVGKQDILVGHSRLGAEFLPYGRRALVLKRTGTPAVRVYLDNVVASSGRMFYVGGSGDAKTGMNQYGLIWKVKCTASYTCSQIGPATVIDPPANSLCGKAADGPDVTAVFVDSQGLAVGDCYLDSFVWSNGQSLNLADTVPVGTATAEFSAADMNAAGQIAVAAQAAHGPYVGYLLRPR